MFLLLLGGLTLGVFGAYCATAVLTWDCPTGEDGWACGLISLFVLLPLGTVLLLASLAHFVAVVGVTRRRWWGDRLGVLLAWAWLAVAALVVLTLVTGWVLGLLSS